MCTGLELLMGLGAVGGVAAQLMQKTPEVPEAEVPATTPDAARDAGATVRVGINEDEEEDEVLEEADNFVPERKQAQTITGLGRGGLAI